MLHERPHAFCIHDVMGNIPEVAVVLEVSALEIYQFGRVDAGDVMDVKMFDSRAPEQMSQHPGVFPLTCTDAIPAGVMLQREGFKVLDLFDGFIVRLSAEQGRLILYRSRLPPSKPHIHAVLRLNP